MFSPHPSSRLVSLDDRPLGDRNRPAPRATLLALCLAGVGLFGLLGGAGEAQATPEMETVSAPSQTSWAARAEAMPVPRLRARLVARAAEGAQRRAGVPAGQGADARGAASSYLARAAR